MLHLPAPNTLSHHPERKKTTKQPSPGSPLPSADDSWAVVTLCSAAPEPVTRGFGVPHSPATDAQCQEAGCHCCEERRETNLALKGSQEGTRLTLTLPPPDLTAPTPFPWRPSDAELEGICSRWGKDSAWRVSGACCLVTSSPAPASDASEGTQAPLPPISSRAQPTAVFPP